MANDLPAQVHGPTERARLEATALVASRVSREESHAIVHRAVLRTWIREVVIILLVIAVGALAYRNFTESSRIKATAVKVEQVNCTSYHDGALIQVLDTTTSVGLNLIADLRNSYFGAQCWTTNVGPLPPPDPRLLPYLSDPAKGPSPG